MAELDVDALKLIVMYLSNPAIDDDVRAATEKELVEQLPAIIAALEDRDRLRAELEQCREAYASLSRAHFQWTALEGRDG